MASKKEIMCPVCNHRLDSKSHADACIPKVEVVEKKNILHISPTLLAGSPIRISQNINAHLNKYNSRLITEHLFGAHQSALLWDLDVLYDRKDTAKYLEMYENADIIHIHNKRRIITFPEVYINKKKCIFHHHGPLYDVGCSEENCNRYTTQAVVAQYQPRVYPKSYMLPNLVYFDDKFKVTELPKDKIHIFFAYASSLEGRNDWSDKGVRYVVAALEKISKEFPKKVVCHTYTNTPFKQLMEIKAACDINIDDIMTGSYHLSSLEAMYFGLVDICNMDAKTELVLEYLTDGKREEFPIVKANKDDLYQTLKNFVEDPQMLEDAKKYTKEWFKKYYNMKKMILFYEDLYDSILEERKPNKCKTFKDMAL